MARFFISMSGEGRGHATRVRSLVERMRDRHEITLFAPGEAYEFLEADYASQTSAQNVRLVKIPGLKFHYVNGRLHLAKTIYEGLRFERRVLPGIVQQLVEEIEEHNPDVLLTDFEPALPRAAYRTGRRYLSLTHQHFLLAYNLRWLPWKLRFFAWFIGLSVPLHYSRQAITMVSSFFPGELLARWERRGAVALGPMIRPEVRAAAISAGIPVEESEKQVPPPPEQLFRPVRADFSTPTNSADSPPAISQPQSAAVPPPEGNASHGQQPRNSEVTAETSHAHSAGWADSENAGGESYFLSYLRKHTPASILDEFEQTGLRIKVYGLGEHPPRGGMTFHAIHPRHFVADLVGAQGVVSAAGNQLLGECMYLGKPVLALPETWHHEQLINAYFLRRMGCGNFVTLEEFRAEHLRQFAREYEAYRTKIEQTCLGVDGTASVIAILEREAASARK